MSNVASKSARAVPLRRGSGRERAAPSASNASGAASGPSLNEVRLIGRLAAIPETRELPSGDRVTMLRLVVARERSRARTPSTGDGSRRPAPTVDTFDCAIWTARLQDRAERLPAGVVLEVEGELRRRFWRSGAAPVSRYEIEVRAMRRIRSP